MQKPILVTGAPGNVSSEIVRLLSVHGQPVRVATRNVDRARSVLGTGVDYVPFSFEAPATYGAAVADVERLYLMRPPAITDMKGLIYPFIDVARAAGVKQIVFMSLLGAEKNPVVPHYKVEQYLKQSGVAYTFLRPTYFMQNLSTTYRDLIRQEQAIFLPVGQGRMSFIDTRDISAVAAKVLVESGHENRAYTLTASEAHDFTAVAAIFTEALGRPIRYPAPSFIAYRRKMSRLGFPASLINVTTMMYLIARLGLSDTVTDDTERLLQRRPLTLRQFVTDHVSAWA